MFDMPTDYKNQRNAQKGKVIKMKPRKAAAAPKKPASKPARSKSVEKKEQTESKKNQSAKFNPFLFKTDNFMENTMKKSNVAFDQFGKDASDISREYSDAVMKSGTILMKGCENMVSVMMSIVQSSAEKQARLLKEAMSSKTINEFAEIQNKIAQTSFDDFMSGATKISEISVKVITESSEPVNAQVTRAIQKATESMAA
jgi:phasin family protein